MANILRLSSRNGNLYDAFLKEHLAGAIRYERIAGYFRSSLLELAQKELERIPDVRIVCNADVAVGDLSAVRNATGTHQTELEQEVVRRAWNDAGFPDLVDTYGASVKNRFAVLAELIESGRQENRRFEIRVVPDAVFGFLHGKGGVIEEKDSRIAFIGSANETAEGWKKNYELVWVDDSPEAVQWMHAEFEVLWAAGFPLSEFVVKQIKRLSTRIVIEHVGDWRTDPEPDSALAEAPANTEFFGFWEHQKYFIDLAYRFHRRYGDVRGQGARFVLADSVGLGKTLQLGAVAKLIALESDEPVVIVAPKALVTQWQDELMSKLAVPSARWETGEWVTEREETHPFPPDGSKLGCPRRVAIIPNSVATSASLSKVNKSLQDRILRSRLSCVIWDEAHKIRRKNLQEARRFRAPEKNTLYELALGLAGKTDTFLMATATPVQLHPIELWDLLNVLSVNNPQILGSRGSSWRKPNKELFDLITGDHTIEDPVERWQWIRNPIADPDLPVSPDLGLLRTTLSLGDTDSVVPEARFDELEEDDKAAIQRHDFQEVNPFTQWVIKRSRDQLEKEGQLPTIELRPFNDEPIESSQSMIRAFELAEDFSRELNRRLKQQGKSAGGFIKTLLQRRVGSSLSAGLKTAEKMYAEAALDTAQEDPGEDQSSIYPLSDSERDILRQLRELLERELKARNDPKFDRVAWLLQQNFDGQSMLERGVLIFSQFYDSAFALALYLQEKTGMRVGLYAGGGSSKSIDGDGAHSIARDKLTAAVNTQDIKILVGTDAASQGLNLQVLGSLINLDLPWNPTILEQRKGRVQRGSISRSIPFANLRYDEAIEATLYEVVSSRLEEITKIFGVVPDFIVDEWIEEILEGQQANGERLVAIASQHAVNPFQLKEINEKSNVEWENTAQVLNETSVADYLRSPW